MPKIQGANAPLLLLMPTISA